MLALDEAAGPGEALLILLLRARPIMPVDLIPLALLSDSLSRRLLSISPFLTPSKLNQRQHRQVFAETSNFYEQCSFVPFLLENAQVPQV